MCICSRVTMSVQCSNWWHTHWSTATSSPHLLGNNHPLPPPRWIPCCAPHTQHYTHTQGGVRKLELILATCAWLSFSSVNLFTPQFVYMQLWFKNGTQHDTNGALGRSRARGGRMGTFLGLIWATFAAHGMPQTYCSHCYSLTQPPQPPASNLDQFCWLLSPAISSPTHICLASKKDTYPNILIANVKGMKSTDSDS